MTDEARSPAPPAGDDFASRVLAVVEGIPEAQVMTYGSVAAAVGSRSARGVGQVMAYAGSGSPWWRVVRASGHPPLGHEQRALEQYRVEGTPLVGGRTGTWRVDLRRAAWEEVTDPADEDRAGGDPTGDDPAHDDPTRDDPTAEG